MRTIITDLQSIEELTKYVDAKDRVYIITTPDGQLPISVANTVMSLKTKPEFVIVTEAEMAQPFALGLRFGFLCATAPGQLMLMLSDDHGQLKALHGLEYPVKGGTVTIEIPGMKYAAKARAKAIRAAKKASEASSSAKKTEPAADFMNQPEPEAAPMPSIPSVTSEPEAAPKRRRRTVKQAEEPASEADAQDEAPKPVRISAKFRKALLAIDENLINDIDGIAAAVGDAIDNTITLEMQLQIHTSRERAAELFPLLSPHYSDLKAAL